MGQGVGRWGGIHTAYASVTFSVSFTQYATTAANTVFREGFTPSPHNTFTPTYDTAITASFTSPILIR